MFIYKLSDKCFLLIIYGHFIIKTGTSTFHRMCLLLIVEIATYNIKRY